MGSRIIRHTGNAAIDLCYGVLVNSDGIKLELIEYSSGSSLCNGELCHVGHGSAIGNGCKHEGKGIGLAPAVVRLCGLKMRCRGSERVGYYQAVFTIVVHLGVDLGYPAIVFSVDTDSFRNGYEHVMRARIVCNTGNVIIDLRYYILKGPYIGIAYEAVNIICYPLEQSQGMESCCHSDIMERHRRTGRDGLEPEPERFRFAPIIEFLGRAKLNCGALEILSGIGNDYLGDIGNDYNIVVIHNKRKCKVHWISRGNYLFARLFHKKVCAILELNESVAGIICRDRADKVFGYGDPIDLFGGRNLADLSLGFGNHVNIEVDIGDGILVFLTPCDLGDAKTNLGLTVENDGLLGVYPGLALGNGDQRLIIAAACSGLIAVNALCKGLSAVHCDPDPVAVVSGDFNIIFRKLGKINSDYRFGLSVFGVYLGFQNDRIVRCDPAVV